MKFDVMMPGTNHIPGMYEWAHQLAPGDQRRILQCIDRGRFHAILVSEHLAMPSFEVPRLGPYWHDALTTMSFIAGVTERVMIDSCLLVLPYHHPLRFSKAIGTLDALSGGRVSLSLGVGHAEQEFAALGVDFAARGRITDEALAALMELWTAAEPVHEGEFFHISGLAVEPKPDPRPRISIGGNSRPALRRAARWDGWQPNPLSTPLDALPAMIAYIEEHRDAARATYPFEVNWLGAPEGLDLPDGFRRADPATLRSFRDRAIEAYTEVFPAIGVHRAAVPRPATIASTDEFLAYLEWFDAEIIEAVGAG
ncbi:TIGR03619 family F420-dependent LLM class oxidoreductase [Microbacterium sp. zg-Y818]|uniref:TIGR03619 family F420-dependent LLM class oxidoreductase n=1 Tax=unclassified Microbacterium TaxID=2609290 RepID=UPI00214CB4EF|nr:MULTISPECIES: TIGR03619 family F420-dependent LLM class oxidoreductase [unclassified Microbacterium]MCR2799354.1 TIGR03619 family F420-dependent LLM class oxidoreductase [Microbacterium sp. zg.Y818]WIM21353.1 TIGR03619 family F420-dependent LLM class oxidoreductase [Microbacterium sp. zg-Y818]